MSRYNVARERAGDTRYHLLRLGPTCQILPGPASGMTPRPAAATIRRLMTLDEKPWWQQGTPKAFRERMTALALPELEALIGEIGGALAVIHGQIAAGDRDDEWLGRARQAQGFITERRAWVRAELQRRNEARRTRNVESKREYLTAARERLNAGDTAGAVAALLDLLEGQHVREP